MPGGQKCVRRTVPVTYSGSTINDIINTLAEEHIPSPKGSEVWAKKTVAIILTNSKYTGNVEILKTDPGRNSYCMWDAHEAIISMEDFARVQKEIERRTKKKRKNERSARALIEEINWPEPER